MTSTEKRRIRRLAKAILEADWLGSEAPTLPSPTALPREQKTPHVR